jgi:hypothetical protein
MKKALLFIATAIVVFASCNKYETYGDMKEKERNAINKFIADSSFTIISEETFTKNGNVTDLSKKEFVKLDKSGIYMQIVRKGCGSMIKDGETLNLMCRFKERNILTDSLTVYNNIDVLASVPDIMRVSRESGTFTASFTSGMMYNAYQSQSVPAGWLIPLSYINVGRQTKPDEEISKVRLIIPHTQGHTYASSNVIPFYYEITFQKEA